MKDYWISTTIEKAITISCSTRIRWKRINCSVYLYSPLPLAELSKRVCLNEFKLKKYFRQVFWRSVFALVQEERLKRAKKGSKLVIYGLQRNLLFLHSGGCGLCDTGGRRGSKLKHRAQPRIKISVAEGLLQHDEGRFAGTMARSDPVHLPLVL